MTGVDVAVVVVAILVAAGAWFVLFGRSRDDIWPRTWAIAGLLILFSLGGLAVADRLDIATRSPRTSDLALGVGVGGAWLAATHIGHAVLCRLFPSFFDQVRDLYQLGVDDPPSRVLGPITAMAVAEELLFRGLIQGLAGMPVAVAAYTAVQLVERKWALALAALSGGVVWGGLAVVTDGLLAPVIAHAIWTIGLTLVVPLRGCGADPIPTPADRMPDHSGR